MKTKSILDYFPNNWTPTDLQKQVLLEVEARWNSAKVMILKLETSSGKSAVAYTIAKWAKAARICTPNTMLVNQYEKQFKDIQVIRSAGHYTCEVRQRRCGAYKSKDRCRGCVYSSELRATKAAKVSVSTYHMGLMLPKYKAVIYDEAHGLSKAIRDHYKSSTFVHTLGAPLTVVGDFDAFNEWATRNRDSHPFLKKYVKDIETTKLKCYNWATDLWKGGGEVYGEKLYKGEPYELPTIESQPYDIYSKPPVFWNTNQKLILMSATIDRPDLYELGLDKERPVFIEGDPPISPDRNPIIKDYVGALSHSNLDSYLDQIIEKIQAYLSEKKGKGVIHATYALAAKISAKLSHKRLITHNPTNMKEKLKEFLLSKDGVFLASGMYEGVSLDYDLADWQVVTKVVWPSLMDPLQQHRSTEDPDYYMWSTLKTMIQIAGRVCRRPDDWGETIILDESFERLLNEGSHLTPKSFIDRILNKEVE